MLITCCFSYLSMLLLNDRLGREWVMNFLMTQRRKRRWPNSTSLSLRVVRNQVVPYLFLFFLLKSRITFISLCCYYSQLIDSLLSYSINDLMIDKILVMIASSWLMKTLYRVFSSVLCFPFHHPFLCKFNCCQFVVNL